MYKRPGPAAYYNSSSSIFEISTTTEYVRSYGLCRVRVMNKPDTFSTILSMEDDDGPNQHEKHIIIEARAQY